VFLSIIIIFGVIIAVNLFPDIYFSIIYKEALVIAIIRGVDGSITIYLSTSVIFILVFALLLIIIIDLTILVIKKQSKILYIGKFIIQYNNSIFINSKNNNSCIYNLYIDNTNHI
jgi:hypothetical protein